MSLSYEYDILNIESDIWNRVSESQYYDRGIGKIVDPYKIVENIALEINSELSQEKLLKATEARINRFKRCLLDIDDNILSTLSRIKELDKKIGLISNSDYVDKLGWSQSPLSKYFDISVFSCDIGYIKPHEKIYKIALKEIDEKPNSCLYIGDGGNDELKTAKELGMTTVLTVNWTKNLWADKIDSINELLMIELK